MARIIVVTSGKGGVGKTTSSASALTSSGVNSRLRMISPQIFSTVKSIALARIAAARRDFQIAACPKCMFTTPPRRPSRQLGVQGPSTVTGSAERTAHEPGDQKDERGHEGVGENIQSATGTRGSRTTGCTPHNEPGRTIEGRSDDRPTRREQTTPDRV